MKVEQLIAQYLFVNKKVSLQGIGTFELTGSADMEEEGRVRFNDGAIVFVFDLKAKADDGLVNFIVEKTRKIKPLAASDLESFTLLGKQFLNIGKPFVIKDLGILLKNQIHQYEFAQGHTVASKIESNDTIIIEKEKSEDEIDFSSPSRKHNINLKKWLPWGIAFFVASITAVLYFAIMRNHPETESPSSVISADTQRMTPSISPQLPADTIKTPVDSTAASLTDTSSFNKTDTLAAHKHLSDTTKISNVRKKSLKP